MNGCSSSSEATDKDDDSQLVEAVSTPDPAFLVEEGAVMGAMQEQHEMKAGKEWHPPFLATLVLLK